MDFSTMTMKTAWLRLLASFILVAPTVRTSLPCSISAYTCAGVACVAQGANASAGSGHSQAAAAGL